MSLADRLVDLAAEHGNRTLGERAFGILHDAIIRGRLEPGERMPIEELAELLGMSPMPIREALRRLDAQGLVDNVPHRGARVAALSINDLAEIYETRLALEPLALRRAAAVFSDADSAQAHEALGRHERAIKARDAGSCWQAHSDFHLLLYGAGSSRWLMRLIVPLWQASERYRHASGLEDWHMKERQPEHRLIVAACDQRDPDAAAEILHDHLSATANQIAHAMGSNEDLFPLLDPEREKPRRNQRTRRASVGT